MGFAAIDAAIGAAGLAAVGWFHPGAEDAVPGNPGTLILLGPDGPSMWAAFRIAHEASDGETDPLDRWSRRVVTALARETGGAPLFPFGGPPWHPFQRWAARGEGARPSPVAMQVTPGRGLWTSYRGALAYTDRLDLPARADADPCLGCLAPCRTTCPVDAFATGSYNLSACTGHMLVAEGAECHLGCLVRRSCPAGAVIDLPQAQRAFHMAAFLRANG